MAVLAAHDLRKFYGGEEVVAGVSFGIAPGECFGLLGPNGAGKTTTLRLCLGLTDPDGGSVELMQRPVPGEARPARARVGVVPQMDNLDPDFTVSEICSSTAVTSASPSAPFASAYPSCSSSRA